LRSPSAKKPSPERREHAEAAWRTGRGVLPRGMRVLTPLFFLMVVAGCGGGDGDGGDVSGKIELKKDLIVLGT
jgi:hypothetical protein